MNMRFLYKDGQEHAVDGNGVEPAILVMLFAIKTKSSQRPTNPAMLPISLFDEKRCYTVYSDERKTRFFHLFFSKCLNATAAAAAAVRQLGIHIRAAQRWVKRYYENSESMFEKKNKSGRHFLLNYVDENPSAVVTEVAESLMQNVADLGVSSINK
ncbi:hypothetical protein BD408DRAFT_475296 [Parasitella parasitica]|nr:hypothetical protein BD408DRAFT_475296 [Parasitella parasitica]